MSEETQSPNPPRRVYKQGYPDDAFEAKVTLVDGLLLVGTLGFIAAAIIDSINRMGGFNAYMVIRDMHYQLSRYGLAVAILMAVLALIFGVWRKDDVLPWFRRGAYVVFGTILLQAVLGFGLLLIFGTQPHQPEHIVYGIAAAACLPFFIFVETTAKKRPAMGSYIWAFVLLIGIIIRAISTGRA